MGYELRDHTADVAVEATADTLGGVFAAVADGMTAAMTDQVPEGGRRREVTVSAESREALLFDYLDELIYERDVHEVLPVDNGATVSGVVDDEATVSGETGAEETGAEETGAEETGAEEAPLDGDDGWRVAASYRGVPLAEVSARDLKAVTYSEMDLSERDGGWHAYVVFDV